MKNLLVIAPSYPYPVQDGTQLRVHNLARRFGPGVEITLLCFDAVDEPVVRPLPEPLSGISVRIPAPARVQGWRRSQLAQLPRRLPGMIWKFYSSAMEAEMRRRAATADAVLVIGLQMGQYLTQVPRNVPKVLDNYNVESLILARMAATRPLSRRWFWLLEAEKLRRAEREIMRLADHVIAISDVDRVGMAELVPKTRFFVVPNGVALDEFVQAPPSETPNAAPRFSFVGALNWHVNEDAASWMGEQVWPLVRTSLPNAELYLVGKDPSPTVRSLAREGSVYVTGTVPDVKPYIAQSSALIVPLRYGSGIRNKILEGFACGRPIITTSVGCEGLPVRDDRHLLIAERAEDFARACVRLIEEPGLGERLVRAGRALVEELDQDVTARFQEVWRDGLRLSEPQPSAAAALRGEPQSSRR